MYNNSGLRLLNGELPLMIWTRSMEAINFAFFLITIRIIQSHSSSSLGAYKYCIYQITIMSALSQQISVLGPVFCMPILAGYVTVELFVSPLAMHILFTIWVGLIFLDLESIMDGFNFRCRVLLKTFYSQYTNKYFWIGISIFAKITTVAEIGSTFLPLGFQLDKGQMRNYIDQKFPNVLQTFDAHKSFFVYDDAMLAEQTVPLVFFIFGILLLCGDCLFAIIIVLCILQIQRSKMSSTTRKMHIRFVVQLIFQASVPLLVTVCPFLTLALFLFVQIPLETNLCGYIILIVMMMHGPLSSIMTIALYDPYRKAVLKFFTRQKASQSVAMSVESQPSGA